MRIAVIADTHNHLPASVRADLASADEIWHLGDICREEILREVRGLGPPVHAVRGNGDPRGLGPASLTLTRGGHIFFLTHEPVSLVPPGAQFALHGHTHVPRDETIGQVRHLNPGTMSKPNHGAPPSFAWLEIGEHEPPRWKIVALP